MLDYRTVESKHGGKVAEVASGISRCGGENTLATSLATRERNLLSYLSDYTDVPGQNKLLTIKEEGN